MTETTADGYEVRCSVIVLRQHAVLLVHRTRHDLDDWVLPGGSPREGESLTACASQPVFLAVLPQARASAAAAATALP